MFHNVCVCTLVDFYVCCAVVLYFVFWVLLCVQAPFGYHGPDYRSDSSSSSSGAWHSPLIYNVSTICSTWYVQAPSNVLQVDLDYWTVSSWWGIGNITLWISSDSRGIFGQMSCMEEYQWRWQRWQRRPTRTIFFIHERTCQVCLTPPVLHSSVFNRWFVGINTHIYIYVYIYIYIYICVMKCCTTPNHT